MFCVNCGNKSKETDKFCSKCGKKLNSNNENKPLKKEVKIFTDTSLFLPNSQKLSSEINDFLTPLEGIKKVTAKHNVSKGHVRNVEITVLYSGELDLEDDPLVFHQVEVITYNLGGIFALSTAGKDEEYKQKWINENPNKKLLYCFNVYDYGRMREQWFYYTERFKKEK